jgi:drug/metabolite transporter superfamily protein YnfA
MNDDPVHEIILYELRAAVCEIKSLREEVAILRTKMSWGSGLIATVTSVIIGVIVNIVSSHKS